MNQAKKCHIRGTISYVVICLSRIQTFSCVHSIVIVCKFTSTYLIRSSREDDGKFLFLTFSKPLQNNHKRAHTLHSQMLANLTCISFISLCSVVVAWSIFIEGYVNGFGDHWFVRYKWDIWRAVDTGYNKNWSS